LGSPVHLDLPRWRSIVATSVTVARACRYLQKLGYRLLRRCSPSPALIRTIRGAHRAAQRAGLAVRITSLRNELDLNLLPGVMLLDQTGQQRMIPTPGQNVKRYGFGVNYAGVSHTIGSQDSAGFIA
jgi:hypothetical protein